MEQHDNCKQEFEMVLIEQIFHLQKETMKRVLLFAQAAMSESQFIAFRKLILDEFGSRGLRKEIVNAVNKVMERAGAEKRE